MASATYQKKGAATRSKEGAERKADLQKWMADEKNVNPIHDHATCIVRHPYCSPEKWCGH